MNGRNVLLLTIDCFRYDRCGFNGHHRPTTPTLDRLAGEATVFDNAISTGPQTVESFPGIIAGLLSHQCARVSDTVNWKAIPPDAETIATHLGSEGYRTIARLNNPFLTSEQNYDLGFDEFTNLKEGDVDHAAGEPGPFGRLLGRVTDGVESRLRAQDRLANPYMLFYVAYQYRRFLEGWPGVHADEVVDAFIEDLDGLDSPYFGWAHFMDLHLPIHPEIANRGGIQRNSYFRHFVAEGARAGEIHDPRFNAIYDGALAFIDAQIKRLLESLRERGDLEDTVVIVTGDHGEALFDRGHYGHPTHYLYDELLHVPLLIRTPDSESARRPEPFSLAWLPELIADVLEIDRGRFPNGSDRPDHLDPAPGSDAVVVSDSISEQGHSVVVRDSQTKYVTHFDGDGVVEEYDVLRDTCFAISSDRGERHPLPGEDAPQSLRQAAEERRTSSDELELVEYVTTDAARARLEELGYRM